eukprot:759451-Hanusia_phi.AAC.8
MTCHNELLLPLPLPLPLLSSSRHRPPRPRPPRPSPSPFPPFSLPRIDPNREVFSPFRYFIRYVSQISARSVRIRNGYNGSCDRFAAQGEFRHVRTSDQQGRCKQAQSWQRRKRDCCSWHFDETGSRRRGCERSRGAG